jgi:ParB family transcriptional regulator, chromosome partitioning protein
MDGPIGQKSRRLGRGLSSLINSPVIVESPSAPETQHNTEHNPITSPAASIAVNSISVSPFQPRRVITEEALNHLAESIQRAGVMQPIIVRPRSGGGFELVAGERRWRAAKKVGLATIPAIVRELSDADAAEWALVENIQREDLNPMERAWALRQMQEKFGLTQAQLAERVSLERSTVANLIRLTDLEPEIAEMIVKGEISAGHGRALLALPAGAPRIGIAKAAAVGGWSVRRIEQAVQRPDEAIPEVAKNVIEDATGREAVLRDLERQISQQLGTKVIINTDKQGKKGKLMIEFYGLDHFDGLLIRMGIRAT